MTLICNHPQNIWLRSGHNLDTLLRHFLHNSAKGNTAGDEKRNKETLINTILFSYFLPDLCSEMEKIGIEWVKFVLQSTWAHKPHEHTWSIDQQWYTDYMMTWCTNYQQLIDSTFQGESLYQYIRTQVKHTTYYCHHCHEKISVKSDSNFDIN